MVTRPGSRPAGPRQRGARADGRRRRRQPPAGPHRARGPRVPRDGRPRCEAPRRRYRETRPTRLRWWRDTQRHWRPCGGQIPHDERAEALPCRLDELAIGGGAVRRGRVPRAPPGRRLTRERVERVDVDPMRAGFDGGARRAPTASPCSSVRSPPGRQRSSYGPRGPPPTTRARLLAFEQGQDPAFPNRQRVPIPQHVRAYLRWQGVACVEPGPGESGRNDGAVVNQVEGRDVLVAQQPPRGRTHVGEADEDATRVDRHDTGKVLAGRGQVVVAELLDGWHTGGRDRARRTRSHGPRVR